MNDVRAFRSRSAAFLNIVWKVTFRDRAAFALLFLSLFLLSFIYVVSVSTLMSLQKKQIVVLSDVVNFDFRVYERDNPGLNAARLSSAEGVDAAYRMADSVVFNVSDGSSATVRYAEEGLYENSRFLSHFDFFDSPDMNFDTVSAPSLWDFGDKFVTVLKGAGGRAVPAVPRIAPELSFSSSDMMVDEYVFSLFGRRPDGTDVFYGIYASDYRKAEKSLKGAGIVFSSFRNEKSGLYSALLVERFLFKSILFFILVLLFVLLLRLLVKAVSDNAENIACMFSLGAGGRTVYFLFALPLFAPAFFASAAGCACGAAFTKSRGFRAAVMNLIFRSAGYGVEMAFDLGSAIGYMGVSVFFFVVISIVIAVMMRRMTVTDIIIGREK